jgi:AraC family transcriptional regulator
MKRFFNSIEYIEQHLYEPVTIHDIAKASNYSAYHFSRIFKSLVGDSPKEYLRKRRLTVAATRLLKEDASILDLAIQCQFESQEAFTRAFKQLFSVTPGQYRKEQDPYRLIYKDQFSPHMLHHLQNSLVMEPEIIDRAAIKTVGIAMRYNNDDLDLKKLWSAFKPYKDTIPNRVGTDLFGIYEEYQENEDSTEFTYVCSAKVSDYSDIPEGMVARDIESQLYACFDHKGPIANLEATLKYIWGSWLPKSKYEYVEKPDFELYAEGFCDAEPDNILKIFIPIKAK